MNCEILAIGSEMLTPFRQDTNSLYLTSRLNALGVNVIAKSVIGDRRALISSAVASSLPRTDIIVVTGGLGPDQRRPHARSRRRRPQHRPCPQSRHPYLALQALR